MLSKYWSEESFLRPAYMSDDVWQDILDNFLNDIGDPINSLPLALQEDKDRLFDMGISHLSDIAA